MVKLQTLFVILIGFLMSSSKVYAEDPATINQLNSVFEGAVSVVALVGGMLAFLALIYGGFKYIIARGDPKAVSGAQGTITWAVIGLAFIVVAWLILQFIGAFTGQPVTDFNINPSPAP